MSMESGIAESPSRSADRPEINETEAGLSPQSQAQTSAARSRRRPRIAFLLPRGEALRNFVYNGMLDDLAEEADVLVLSVEHPNDLGDYLRSKFPDIRPLREVADRWPTRFVRDWLDTAHGRHLWSEAAKQRWKLRDLECRTPLQKLKRVVDKGLAIAFANRPGLASLSGLEEWASRTLRTSDAYHALFREWRPDLVFNGSHSHSPIALPAIHAAKALNIPTAAFLFSWDNLTSQGRIIPQYDTYFAWNPTIRADLLRIYPQIRPESVVVSGTPQFDMHFRDDDVWSRAEYCAKIGADPQRPIVLYSTGMAYQMPGEVELVERLGDLVANIDVRDLDLGPNPNPNSWQGPPRLVVRVYAKDRTQRFEPLKQARPDILFPPVPWEKVWYTPRPEDGPLWSNMLRHADVGINIASTVSLELCMFDKPVINLAYNAPNVDPGVVDVAMYYGFDHYRPIVESGAIALARSEQETRDLVKESLRHPEIRSRERRDLIQTMFGDQLDGWAGRRLARQIARAASN